MNEDPTAPLGTPVGSPFGPPTEPPAGPGTDVCPNGHVLAADQVIIRNGQKVCPICEQQASAWALPPRRPVFWTRQALRIPLILIAAAFVAEGIASAFGISTAASYLNHQLPGSTSQLLSSIFDTICQFALAAGAGWIAYLVGQESPPGQTPPGP